MRRKTKKRWTEVDAQRVLLPLGFSVLNGAAVTGHLLSEETFKLAKHNKWVKGSYGIVERLTPRGRKMAVARAARELMRREHHSILEAQCDAVYELVVEANDDQEEYNMPDWMSDASLTDAEVIERVKKLRAAMLEHERLTGEYNAPLPKVTLREAEVWVMQKKLEGKLGELLERLT